MTRFEHKRNKFIRQLNDANPHLPEGYSIARDMTHPGVWTEAGMMAIAEMVEDLADTIRERA